ncbi:hypothetical protein SAMN05443247_10329 [Bradyrhizobium erythrophlei]|jgi:uncharacterized protein|nr:hypothetical protein SAMN05443247_10329 [Bradyrhizobium erythrophlei]
MKAAVDDIGLCFVATASSDGMPNVSPKGSLTVWDGDHLAFANIASPRTMKNIKENLKLEINTIDQICRRGFRFKETGEIFERGDVFDHVANDIWNREGRDVPIHAIVKVRVLEAQEVLSPAYWLRKGVTVEEVRQVWAGRFGYKIIPK